MKKQLAAFAVELLRYLSLPASEGANKYDVMSVVKSFWTMRIASVLS